MVEQAEILEHDADAPAQRRDRVLRQGRDIVAELVISPRVGLSDRNSSRSSEVLPAPEGPVRNWKECGSMRNVRSRRTSGPRP